MYAYIKGTVELVGPEYIVVECNGIGYQILTPNPFVFSGKKGKELTIYTYQHVREDLIALYGFETQLEKKMFKKLISVSGIGPKGAMAILAFGEPEQVVRAIENEDEKFLTKFPGVGKKTARQMILDLKGKLEDILPESLEAEPGPVKKDDSSGTSLWRRIGRSAAGLGGLGIFGTGIEKNQHATRERKNDYRSIH